MKLKLALFILWITLGGGSLFAAQGILSNQTIYVENAQKYSINHGCSGNCMYSYHFWVDLVVKNLSPEKKVFIKWKTNGWDEKTAEAVYRKDLSDGYELWHVEMRIQQGANITFQAFAEMNNHTYSAYNYKTYRVGEKNYEGTPIRLVRNSDIGNRRFRNTGPLNLGNSYEHGKLAFFGQLEVFPFSSEDTKRITLVYTTDDWQSQKLVDLSYLLYQSAPKNFIIPVEGIDTQNLPANIQAVLSYNINEDEFWLSQNGYNYRFEIDPSLHVYGHRGSTQSYFIENLFQINQKGDPIPLSSNEVAKMHIGGDIYVDHIYKAYDEGEWQYVSNNSSGLLNFDYDRLDQGDHTLKLKIQLEGGLEKVFTIPFTVKKVFNAKEQFPIKDHFNLDLEDEKVTLMTETEQSLYLVLDHNTLVKDNEVFSQLSEWEILALDEDPKGQLYLMVRNDQKDILLTRLDSGGQVDENFGKDGIALLAKKIPSTSYYQGRIQAQVLLTDKGILTYLYQDRKQGHISLLDHAGVIAQQLPFKYNYKENYPLGILQEGEKVSALGNRNLKTYQILKSEEGVLSLQLNNTKPLSKKMQNLFWRQDDLDLKSIPGTEYYLMINDGGMAVVTNEGEFVSFWNSDDYLGLEKGVNYQSYGGSIFNEEEIWILDDENQKLVKIELQNL